MRLIVACAFLFVARLHATPPAASSLRPVELTCEHRVNPAGLGEKAPRLGWKLAAASPMARNLSQAGYRILVAASPEILANGRGDLWDTGRVDSSQTSEIVYSGRPLESRQQCWWKVLVWDQDGKVSGWSEPARWSMALLGASEWRAKWIGLDEDPPQDGSVLTTAQRAEFATLDWAQAAVAASKESPITVFIRRGFGVPPGLVLTRATLLVTADQRCSITLNDKPAGESTRWEPARPFDLTRDVQTGDNAVLLRVTQEDGYAPAVVGELELAFANGTVIRLPINATWRFARAASEDSAPPAMSEGAWMPLADIPGRRTPWSTPSDAFHFFAPPPWLRKSFAVSKPVRRATLYATALGLYAAQLNGARVSDDYFTPGWTDYGHRVQYQTCDVTHLVQPGENTLSALLGDGWYAGIGAYTGRRHMYGGFPRFAAQMEIDYVDGSRDTVITDGSWMGATGPIRYADLYQGCATDLRRKIDDWRPVATGLRQVPDDPVKLETHFILEPSTVDPVRVSEVRPAERVTEPRPGVYVVDFGQNLVGWVKLRARGGDGDKIVVRHGEMLNPNGTVYTSNLRGAAATDEYRLRGGGEETLEPQFTLHGFRYAEITGLKGRPATDAVSAIVAGSPLRRTGEFSCSNPLVNQLYHNIIWGQRGNYLEAPTDCPQRDERLGWTGDTQFFMPTAAYNFDVASFVERWLITMTDDQGIDGTFPTVAPKTAMNPYGATAWGDAAIVCTYDLWRYYGDTRIISRRFESLSRYIDWLEVSAQGNILAVGGPEDWLNKGGGANSDAIDTAYGTYLCGLMSEMARAVGRTEEAGRFSALQRKFARGFQDNFLLPDGRIWDSSQTGYALAFTMNLLPADLRDKAARRFVADIASRNWHLATGFIGTPRLLPALDDAGRDDVAYRLLLQDTYPSWLYQVKLGATTMWERWDGWTPEKGFQTIGMNSFNHYAFGAVGEFLYRRVLGIDTDGPGFRRILIQPSPGGGLTWASGSYDAAPGRIACAWKIDSDRFVLDATIPPNVTATITLPSGRKREIGSGAWHFEEQAPRP